MPLRLLCLLLLLQHTAGYARQPQRYDLLITELFPDPSPPIGLPDNEFIELKNVSNSNINLKGWKLSDGSATATINVSIEIKPDSFVIICPNSAVSSYTSFGTTIGVTNFPALNNEGDLITLYAPEGKAIHAVPYTNQWYNNAVKAGGGWTLEMIDTQNPCTGAGNWTASPHIHGGTPGSANAAAHSNKDDMPPALLRTYAIDSSTLVAVFDESLDSSSAADATKYTFDHSLGNLLTATPVAPVFAQVELKLEKPIAIQQVYRLTVNNVVDCSGNTIGLVNQAKTGLPQVADTQDIVINEVLFNPASGGYDYVEVYNRSNKIIDLKQLYFANRPAGGQLTNIRQLSTSAYQLFPGEYLVFTEDAAWVKQHYVVKDPMVLQQLSALPSMPDDKGTLVVTNLQGIVVDELTYDRQWHFKLISEEDGVALERINYNQPAQSSHNWMSAASTAGYGTPGYQNSQFRADLAARGHIAIAPASFSPDNDGYDDFASIQYQVEQPGFVANITIFDAAGAPVRHLARSATLGLQGLFRWDGLDNHQRKLPVGNYIVYTELFNLQGKTKKFKNTVTLVRRL